VNAPTGTERCGVLAAPTGDSRRSPPCRIEQSSPTRLSRGSHHEQAARGLQVDSRPTMSRGRSGRRTGDAAAPPQLPAITRAMLCFAEARARRSSTCRGPRRGCGCFPRDADHFVIPAGRCNQPAAAQTSPGCAKRRLGFPFLRRLARIEANAPRCGGRAGRWLETPRARLRRKTDRHGPDSRQAGRLFRSRPALVRENGQGRQQRKPPRGQAARIARQRLWPDNRFARHSVRNPRNHRNRLRLWERRWKSIRPGKAKPARMAFCLIRSGELQLPQRHISPTAHAQRLLQPRAAAHPQVAGPPTARSTSCAIALDRRGSPSDPPQPPPQGSWIPKLTIAGQGASCTTSRQTTPQGCDRGKRSSPWPGFKPSGLAIPL